MADIHTDPPPRIRRAAIVALAVGALVLTGSPALALGWTVVPSPDETPGNNHLYGADASAAGDVWAVGVVIPPLGGPHRALALRHDGTAWRPVPRTGLPANSGLRGVDAVSATDVWAAGSSVGAGVISYDTLVAHWNGTAWTREPTPNGNPGGMNNLTGVTVAGSTVWAVGTYVDPASASNRRKLILQRTGGSWRTATAPTVAPYETLAAVDATGPSDVWAVGSASTSPGTTVTPLVLRYSGTGWTSATLPAPTGTALTGVDARTTTDVWAVGTSAGPRPYVAHFDGTTWRQVTLPALPGGGELADVAAVSASTVVAVGRAPGSPLVLRGGGSSSWTRDTTPTPTGPYLSGAAVSGTGAVWAVGYRFELNAYANRTLTMLGS